MGALSLSTVTTYKVATQLFVVPLRYVVVTLIQLICTCIDTKAINPRILAGIRSEYKGACIRSCMFLVEDLSKSHDGQWISGFVFLAV